MKGQPFQVGDKVVLAVDVGRLTIVPQLVPGRVYCVSAVSILESGICGAHERVCLVGVRRDRRYWDRRGNDSLLAAYFRRVGRAGSNARRQEDT